MIWAVVWRRFFWKGLLELAALEFAVNFIDSYELARRDARRRLHGRR